MNRVNNSAFQFFTDLSNSLVMIHLYHHRRHYHHHHRRHHYHHHYRHYHHHRRHHYHHHYHITTSAITVIIIIILIGFFPNSNIISCRNILCSLPRSQMPYTQEKTIHSENRACKATYQTVPKETKNTHWTYLVQNKTNKKTVENTLQETLVQAV